MSSSKPQLPLDKFLATAGKLTMPELVQWPTTWAEWFKPHRKEGEGAPTPTEAAIVLCIPGSNQDKNAQYWSAAYDHTLAHYLLGHATFMGYGDTFEIIKSALSGFVEYVEEYKIQKSYVVICIEYNKGDEVGVNDFISDIICNNNKLLPIIIRGDRNYNDIKRIKHIPINCNDYLEYVGQQNIITVIQSKASVHVFWKNLPEKIDNFNYFYELSLPMTLFHLNDIKSDVNTTNTIKEIIWRYGIEDFEIKINNDLRDNRKIDVLFISLLLMRFYILGDFNQEIFLIKIHSIKTSDLFDNWHRIGEFLNEDLILQLTLLHLFTELDFLGNHTLDREDLNKLINLAAYEIPDLCNNIPGSDNKISISLKSTLQSLLLRIKEAMEMKEKIEFTSVDRVKELIELREKMTTLESEVKNIKEIPGKLTDYLENPALQVHDGSEVESSVERLARIITTRFHEQHQWFKQLILVFIWIFLSSILVMMVILILILIKTYSDLL